MSKKRLIIEGYQPIAGDSYQPIVGIPNGKNQNIPVSKAVPSVKIIPPKGGTGEITLKK